ncbi:uncharacterized protein A4U43_C10F10480 [Asparagus officinalis]|uniref:Uncharacterized protein n=1 Tax=Asparagus officinalis TaxID=4686 RepID=A0A5P1E1Y0_ASPOF|nr:uncharacterized protein A4U43_C10F10480 [Asparagus officinalis]
MHELRRQWENLPVLIVEHIALRLDGPLTFSSFASSANRGDQSPSPASATSSPRNPPYSSTSHHLLYPSTPPTSSPRTDSTFSPTGSWPLPCQISAAILATPTGTLSVNGSRWKSRVFSQGDGNILNLVVHSNKLYVRFCSNKVEVMDTAGGSIQRVRTIIRPMNCLSELPMFVESDDELLLMWYDDREFEGYRDPIFIGGRGGGREDGGFGCRSVFYTVITGCKVSAVEG